MSEANRDVGVPVAAELLHLASGPLPHAVLRADHAGHGGKADGDGAAELQFKSGEVAMTTLVISYANPTFTRTDVRDRFDLALGVEATLELTVGGRLIYAEPMFPIIELRQALSAWMPSIAGDFEFISMESDEPGLVWIRRQPSGRWRVGSIHQDDIALPELDTIEVLDECRDFVARVDAWVREELRVEVSDIFGH